MLARGQHQTRGCGWLQRRRWTQDLQPKTGGAGNRLRVEVLQDEEIAHWYDTRLRVMVGCKACNQRQRARFQRRSMALRTRVAARVLYLVKIGPQWTPTDHSLSH